MAPRSCYQNFIAQTRTQHGLQARRPPIRLKKNRWAVLDDLVEDEADGPPLSRETALRELDAIFDADNQSSEDQSDAFIERLSMFEEDGEPTPAPSASTPDVVRQYANVVYAHRPIPGRLMWNDGKIDLSLDLPQTE